MSVLGSPSFPQASLVAQLVKNQPVTQETGSISDVRKIPWRREWLPTPIFLGFPGGSAGEESPAMWETWVGKIPWRRAWLPTPVFLPGESSRTEEPGGLQSMGMQSRIRLSAAQFSTEHSSPTQPQPVPSVLEMKTLQRGKEIRSGPRLGGEVRASPQLPADGRSISQLH